MISAAPRSRRVIASGFFAALVALALGYPATAAAEPPVCPQNTVTIGNQGQVVKVPQYTQLCDDDQTGGLLGNSPLVGNLPGLGGLL
jgi:hypothetical protein